MHMFRFTILTVMSWEITLHSPRNKMQLINEVELEILRSEKINYISIVILVISHSVPKNVYIKVYIFLRYNEKKKL